MGVFDTRDYNASERNIIFGKISVEMIGYNQDLRALCIKHKTTDVESKWTWEHLQRLELEKQYGIKGRKRIFNDTEATHEFDKFYVWLIFGRQRAFSFKQIFFQSSL